MNAVELRLHFLPPYDPDDNRIERKLTGELSFSFSLRPSLQYNDDGAFSVGLMLTSGRGSTAQTGLNRVIGLAFLIPFNVSNWSIPKDI
jgi:hypothetical protein